MVRRNLNSVDAISLGEFSNHVLVFRTSVYNQPSEDAVPADNFFPDKLGDRPGIGFDECSRLNPSG